MKIIPSPGLALVLPLEEKSTSGIITGKEKGKRILRGKIIEMGADDTNNYGGVVKASSYGKKGDIIDFLSYYEEGGYDQKTIDNETYYYVKFGDFRAVIK